MDIDTDTHRRPRKRMRPSPSPSPSSHLSRPLCSPPRATSTTASASPATTSPAPTMTSAPAPAPRTPLLALPPELLTLIALRLATTPPNLGPPAALLPLLLTCRAVYERLTWRAEGGRGLWVRVGGAKFAVLPPALDFLEDFEDFADGDDVGLWKDCGVRTLHTHLATLRVLRTGDPFHPLAGRALRNAYWMLIADGGSAPGSMCTADDEDGGGGKVHDRIGLSSGTPSLASLGLITSSSTSTNSTSTNSTSGGRTRGGEGVGKNRRQLAWAGARAFALRWVRERLWEGRFGERVEAAADAEREGGFDGAQMEEREEEGEEEEEGQGQEGEEDPQNAGWPRDTDTHAAALWVLWFFEDGATLRPEPDAARRHLMGLLLPFVVAGFRGYARRIRPAPLRRDLRVYVQDVSSQTRYSPHAEVERGGRESVHQVCGQAGRVAWIRNPLPVRIFVRGGACIGIGTGVGIGTGRQVDPGPCPCALMSVGVGVGAGLGVVSVSVSCRCRLGWGAHDSRAPYARSPWMRRFSGVGAHSAADVKGERGASSLRTPSIFRLTGARRVRAGTEEKNACARLPGSRGAVYSRAVGGAGRV
ncbi:hypothetical protein B0H11DRAFT_2356445 [Mycena galericulata]|nr:hypothetical protein B0H11DRAFT_2356445 [Mycena galericulata]